MSMKVFLMEIQLIAIMLENWISLTEEIIQNILTGASMLILPLKYQFKYANLI